MGDHIELGELVVEVTFKQIKNIHLSVHPPSGRVTVSAPNHMRIDVLRAYVISKLDWIRNQRKKILQQDRETEREFINRETHFVWGRRYLLSIIEKEEPPKIEISYNQFILQVRPHTSQEKRELLVDRWYREQVRQEAAPLIKNWETILNVKTETVFVRRMKTRWGSCQPVAKRILLNTDLAKKPVECLEYIIVHELVHLIEPTHNARFIALMDQYLPQWKHLKRLLNELPLRHEEWVY